MKAALERIWWRVSPPPWFLRMLEPLYVAVAGHLAARRRRTARQLPVPVVVVGNVAIGGTGKTPVTLALIEWLRDLGHTPGVLSRGYGGMGPFPLLVDARTSPELAGDEPVLIAARSLAPVCVAPSRFLAGQALLAAHPRVDVLLCDDGLQHYALARALECCVIDGLRGHGNGHCLPAGPLREPPSRADTCDLLLVNGGDPGPYGPRAVRFDLEAREIVALHGDRRRPLADLAGCTVEAVAGIGNPGRFFQQLRAAGLVVRGHPFDDHQPYRAEDLQFAGDAPVLMTEKDAVKCRLLDLPAGRDYWVVPVTAVFHQEAGTRVQECLRQLRNAPPPAMTSP